MFFLYIYIWSYGVYMYVYIYMIYVEILSTCILRLCGVHSCNRQIPSARWSTKSEFRSHRIHLWYIVYLPTFTWKINSYVDKYTIRIDPMGVVMLQLLKNIFALGNSGKFRRWKQFWWVFCGDGEMITHPVFYLFNRLLTGEFPTYCFY